MTDINLLGGLFLSALLSATLLPGSSEAVLTALLIQKPHLAGWAFWTAGLSNSLGSMISYAMGYWIPEKYTHKISDKARHYIQRFGIPLLVFSWVPVVGDALPPVAGLLRLNPYACAFAITVGKFARYALIIFALTWLNH